MYDNRSADLDCQNPRSQVTSYQCEQEYFIIDGSRRRKCFRVIAEWMHRSLVGGETYRQRSAENQVSGDGIANQDGCRINLACPISGQEDDYIW